MPIRGDSSPPPGPFMSESTISGLYTCYGEGTQDNPYVGFILCYADDINSLGVSFNILVPSNQYFWIKFKSWHICLSNAAMAGLYVTPRTAVNDILAGFYQPLARPWLVTRNTEDEEARSCDEAIYLGAQPGFDRGLPGYLVKFAGGGVGGAGGMLVQFVASGAGFGANDAIRSIFTVEWGDKP